MRFATLSLDFGLLLLVIVALIHTQGANANPGEKCAESNCLSANKCEIPSKSLSCPNSDEICCSQVKREFKTLCHHWNGECMDRCNERLTEKATDCPANQVCCVLV